ncbi:MAG: lipase family protein [Melioribacteraceae bacterium]|nr:lipase family protein [Melioribacteraceae bacterium]
MKYLRIGFNWLILAGIGGAAFYYSDSWFRFATDYPELSIPAASALLSSLIFSFRRRVKTKERVANYFTEEKLMDPPANKFRYSDRMAYILAEMSDLAYFEVERENDNFIRFIGEAIKTDPSNAEMLGKLVDRYKELTRSISTSGTAIVSEKDLADLLDKNGFEYKPPYLNCGSAQGFMCVWKNRESPFVVVAFRGSEKKIEDWLTNADALPASPTEVEKGKVHRGFYRDFMGLKDQIEKTLSEICREVDNNCVPVYFTGHSLGGAVATIATRELMSDGEGACYTFGAPRVGDYEYFEFVKTPVYRIVNSSDIIPTVPPGAWTALFMKFIALLRFMLIKVKGAEKLLTEIEGWLDKLKDYRHFGDLRYLTDVQAGEFDKTFLLRNPSYLDVVQWFWRHITVSLGMPVKSHGMRIYREKLKSVAVRRIHHKSIGKAYGYFAARS